MPAGQPTLLTPAVLEDVRRILPTVMYLESVGDYLGVARTTWRGWLRRGHKEAKRLRNPRCKPNPVEAIYLEFLHTCKKALAEGEIYDAGVIKKAAAEQWQAAAWRLERRFPDRWGKRERLDHQHTGTGPGGSIPIAYIIEPADAQPLGLPAPPQVVIEDADIIEETVDDALPATDRDDGA